MTRPDTMRSGSTSGLAACRAEEETPYRLAIPNHVSPQAIVCVLPLPAAGRAVTVEEPAPVVGRADGEADGAGLAIVGLALVPALLVPALARGVGVVAVDAAAVIVEPERGTGPEPVLRAESAGGVAARTESPITTTERSVRGAGRPRLVTAKGSSTADCPCTAGTVSNATENPTKDGTSARSFITFDTEASESHRRATARYTLAGVDIRPDAG